MNLVDPECALGDELEPEIVCATGIVPFGDRTASAAVPVERDGDAKPLPVVTSSSDRADDLRTGDVFYALPRDGADVQYLVATSTPFEHLADLDS